MQDLLVLAAFVSPYKKDRKMIENIVEKIILSKFLLTQLLENVKAVMLKGFIKKQGMEKLKILQVSTHLMKRLKIQI